MTTDPSPGSRDAGRFRLAGTLVGAAAMIAVLTLVSRVLGFGRWLVQSATVGSGCVGDTYNAANQIPNVVYEVVVGGALAAAVVPVVAPLVHGEGRARRRQTVSALLTWALLLSVPLWLLLSVFAGPLGGLLGRSGCAGSDALATVFLLIFAPQVVLYALGVVFGGVLQAHRRFFWPAMAPVLSSVVVIISYLMVGATIGDHANDAAGLPTSAQNWLAWGTTAGVLALSLPMLFPVLRLVGAPTPTLRFPEGQGQLVRRQAIGGLAALLAQQAYVVCVLALTRRAGVPVNALPVFQYAQAVYLLPFAVLVAPVVTSVFPALSAARTDRERFDELSANTLRRVFLLGAIGTAALTGASPAVEVFFERVVREGTSVTGLATAVCAMAAGLPGFAVATQASRALQALGRARTAATGFGVGWLLAVVASVLLVVMWGPGNTTAAITIGGAIGMLCAGVVLTWQLCQAAGPAAGAGLLPILAWTVLITCTGGAVAWLASWLALGDSASASWAVLVGVFGAVMAALPVAGYTWRVEPGLQRVLRGGAR